jgi:hypothetical protein
MAHDRVPPVTADDSSDYPEEGTDDYAQREARTTNQPTRIDARTIITGAIALKMDQAVRLSNLSTATLYRAMARGDLKRRKCGHRTLIMFADLEAFLKRLPEEP